MGYIMGKGKSKKDVDAKPVAAKPEGLDVTKSRAVKKQVSVLAKLTGWQKKPAETDWVIGEYLESP